VSFFDSAVDFPMDCCGNVRGLLRVSWIFVWICLTHLCETKRPKTIHAKKSLQNSLHDFGEGVVPWKNSRRTQQIHGTLKKSRHPSCQKRALRV